MTQTNTLQYIKPDERNHVEKPFLDQLTGKSRVTPLPKNVGLLFFNEHPERFFPTTRIDVVWFPEGAGGDRFDEKTFEGPLARITRDAMNYIQTNYLKQTVKNWPLPRAVLRESQRS